MHARRSWLSGLGATAAALVLGSGQVAAQSSTGGFRPARHSEDDWLDALPGKHRTFVDTSDASGVTDGLLNTNNLYAANQSGYGLGDKDVAVVFCLRHASTVFAFNDAMWAKYGKAFSDRASFKDPKTQQAPSVNLFNTPSADVGTRGVTFDALAKRGTHFAICAMATRNVAGLIATASGGNADAIVKELMANAIGSSHFVAAGVVAVNRAQERGYTLLRA